MQGMKDFCLWFIDQLPTFLMSEPVCYFVGFFFSFAIIGLIARLMNIK